MARTFQRSGVRISIARTAALADASPAQRAACNSQGKICWTITFVLPTPWLDRYLGGVWVLAGLRLSHKMRLLMMLVTATLSAMLTRLLDQCCQTTFPFPCMLMVSLLSVVSAVSGYPSHLEFALTLRGAHSRQSVRAVKDVARTSQSTRTCCAIRGASRAQGDASLAPRAESNSLLV